MPPYRLSGNVYGTLLNHRSALAALGDAVNHTPYQAPPRAPVLYIKPRNTLAGPGDAVVVPADVSEMEVGATLGLVIGRTACRVSEADALAYVAGYTIVNDVNVPHDSVYRPALRFRVRDGSCPIGPGVVRRDAIANPDALTIRTLVDGEPVSQSSTADLVRPVARLLADVTEFMTLSPGDVLMVGVAAGAPRLRAGQQVVIEIDGVGRLENRFVAERLDAERVDADVPAASRPIAPPATGPRARVAYAGAIHAATPHERGLQLADGRVLAEDAVVWLPPFDVGTVIALGLNYADHARELAFSAQQEPLAFLKGPGTLIGHRGQTRRPADVKYMHYECELAVVIGRPARKVRRADAMAHVAGYTVANDYAIRDYLENYCRPNLRVKNRDGCTALGPWFVDAATAGEPQFALRTWVNGKLTQQGHTRDLVFDIPTLIETLSGFMTLLPGDVILTGTPEGVVDVQPGDEVVTEIDGIGRLVNTIVGDDRFGR